VVAHPWKDMEARIINAINSTYVFIRILFDGSAFIPKTAIEPQRRKEREVNQEDGKIQE
jgi:hypothetical protein